MKLAKGEAIPQGSERDPCRPRTQEEHGKSKAGHVLLCWLALLLIRIIETTTGTTWPTARRELDRLHLGTFTGPAGLFRQVTDLTKPQRDLLAKLGIPAPKRVIDLQPTPR